jgi:hypothetical protein
LGSEVHPLPENGLQHLLFDPDPLLHQLLHFPHNSHQLLFIDVLADRNTVLLMEGKAPLVVEVQHQSPLDIAAYFLKIFDSSPRTVGFIGPIKHSR